MKNESKQNRSKRKVLSLSVGALCLALTLGVTACSEIPCLYTEGECSGVCTGECEGEHVHSYDTVQYDEEGHWWVCSCGETTTKEAHSFEVASTVDPYYDYETDEAKDGETTYACTVCSYSYSVPIENKNDYSDKSGERTEQAAQVTLDAIPDDGGSITLLNDEYDTLYIRVSDSASSSSGSSGYTRTITDLTIKGDGETIVDGLLINSEYYNDTVEPTRFLDESPATTELIIKNLTIENIIFTSAIKVTGDVQIEGLTIKDCTYQYPSAYRYTGDNTPSDGGKAPLEDTTSVGLLYASNTTEHKWKDVVIDGCTVNEPYRAIECLGNIDISITNSEFNVYRQHSYLTSYNATSTGTASLPSTYSYVMRFVKSSNESINTYSANIKISGNTINGGWHTMNSSMTFNESSLNSNGAGVLLINGVQEGSITVTDNVVMDSAICRSGIVLGCYNIASDVEVNVEDGNTYGTTTIGLNIIDEFPTEEVADSSGLTNYFWSPRLTDTTYDFDSQEQVDYFCLECMDHHNNTDHDTHTPGVGTGHYDGIYDEANSAMLIYNWYNLRCPNLLFDTGYLRWDRFDYSLEFEFDFSSFSEETLDEYITVGSFVADNYNEAGCKFGYDHEAKTYYVEAYCYDHSMTGSPRLTKKATELDGHVLVDFTYSFDPTGGTNNNGSMDYIVTVHEISSGRQVVTLSGHYQNSNSSTYTPYSQKGLQWNFEAHHNNSDTDTEETRDQEHWGYTQEGHYCEVDNFSIFPHDKSWTYGTSSN